MRSKTTIDKMAVGRHFGKRAIVIFLAAAGMLSFGTTSLAADKCCTCIHPQLAGEKICLTTSGDCTTLAAGANTELKTLTCTQVPDAQAATQCQIKPQGVCYNTPTAANTFKLTDLPIKLSGSTSQTNQDQFAGEPLKLNVPLGGLTQLDAPTKKDNYVTVGFYAQYVSTFEKYLIGIGMIAAAVMVVYGGFLYIVSATGAKTKEGKKIIIDAIIGLVILLSSYVILVNVNPATTVLNSLNIEYVEKKLILLDQASYNQVAGQSNFYNSGDYNVPSEEIFQRAASVAKQNGIDPCIAVATVKTESSGKPNAIGHDENFNYVKPGVSIPQSRVDFLRSRTYYSGKKFTSSVPVMPGECKGSETCRAISKDGPLNDDSREQLDTGKPDLGLDMRFSHGFGLSQYTIFKSTKQCNGSWSIDINGRCFTAADLLTIDGGITAMINHPGIQKNKNSPQSAFEGYIGPPNPGLLAKKMAAYEACKNSGKYK